MSPVGPLAFVAAVLMLAGCGAPAAPVPPSAAPARSPSTEANVVVATPSAEPPATAPTAVSTSAPRSVATTAPTALATATQAPSEPSAPTEVGAVASGFDAALNSGNVEATMALFANGAEVKVPPDRYVGAGQIRNWVEYLSAIHFYAEPGLRRVNGNRLTWQSEVTSDFLVQLGVPTLRGAATMVVEEGKIAAYTFVLDRDSTIRLREARLAASQVLQNPLIVGLDLANIYGVDDVFRDNEGKIVSYRTILSAEPDSGPYYDLGGQPIVIRSGI